MSRVSIGSRSVTINGPAESIFDSYSSKFYRDDIQGIRAISALLIMIYHIWFNRVSGGVDVFFVISGFLITTTLLRGLASTGRVRPTLFWSRICRRIFPSAYTVLITTLALSILFVPAPLWKYGVNEFVAASAQVENLELIRMGADYLAREAPPSQFQQFWALSIQMQFYLALPIVVMLLAHFAHRRQSLRPMYAGIAVLITASFVFSVVLTQVQPNEAYFHPLTRAWEFLAGGLVALFYPKIAGSENASNARIWNIVTFAAIAVLASLGLTLGGTAAFPGWVAMLPVACAVILIIAGAASRTQPLVTAALSHPVLVYFGKFSFTIYLWHWPLLVFAHHLFQTTSLNFIQGAGVIMTALVLAVGTTRFIENPLTRRPIIKPVLLLVLQVGFALMIVGIGLFLRQGIVQMAASQTGNIENIGRTGTLALQDDTNISLEKFITVDLDRPAGIACLTQECVGGDEEADRLIVMSGFSHSAQWFDIVDQLGQEHGYRVVTRFQQQDLAAVIADTGADVLLMNSTKTSESGSGKQERLPEADVEQWKELASQGVHVIVIRDNPRFGFYQNACVWQHQDDAVECAIRQSEILREVDPVAEIDRELDHLYAVDLTQLFCADGMCPAVHDDVMMYYDKHHISKSYSNYIEGSVISAIEKAAPDLFSKTQ